MLPKIIYVNCYDKDRLHKIFKDNIKDMEDRLNYEVQIFDHNDMDNYFKNHINGEYYRKINQQYGNVLSDYFRFNILYDRGGIYIDIKSNIRNLKFIDENIDSGLFYWDTWEEVKCGFLYSKKGNPLFRKVIEQANKNITNYDGSVGRKGSVNLSGPKCLTQVFKRYMNLKNPDLLDIDGFKIKLYPRWQPYLTRCIVKNYADYYIQPHYAKLKCPIINF